MSGLHSLQAVASAPTEMMPDAMSRVLAVLTAEIVGALALSDKAAVLERITNRLDGHARRCRGDAAQMLGAVSAGLMRMEG